jgi:Ca-activated chloride channel family protein
VRFLWPEALALGALLPLLALGYRWLLRRRRSAAVPVASLALIRQAMAGPPGWRRHVPPLLLLLAVALALLAIARPVAVVRLPSNDRTVILAIDASGSMRARDIAPSRIDAARAAARAFVDQLPASTKVGLVTFAATASVAQAPTTARDGFFDALERFPLQRGTAAGSAIAVSLQLLFPDLAIDLNAPDLKPRPRADPFGAPGGNAVTVPGGEPARAGKPDAAAPPPAEPGSYAKAAIILLSDGQTNIGPEPQVAAKLAAERGVRVHTVAVGTAQGESLSVEGWSMRVRLDEASLRTIADLTRGSFFATASGADLRAAYEALSARIAFESREIEIGAPLLGGAALLMLLAAALSRWWLGGLG